MRGTARRWSVGQLPAVRMVGPASFSTMRGRDAGVEGFGAGTTRMVAP